MAIKPFVNTVVQRKRLLHHMVIMAMLAVIILPGIAMADSDATSNICGVLNTINKLLNVASVIVVTIAIIFSGYQIAFAHKRISDVAPALIGGVLIGAAAQIAKMVIGGSDSSSSCSPTQNNQLGMLMMEGLNSVAQFIQNHA